uniref:NADH dehydrogenase subunit 6 n=1 Tax=Ornithodoros tabajara TaxID=2928877 RepID=UPI002237C302|nr:NADH dehydrogenase subunit 6 [Ornithodoros tabajara]UYB78649.1 NADH dehydrogenase subunit 6 [Ornithodoros tabajara]UYB78662.1 NADH dehydrogenase subunit 6 [Ornithodoros tabajara]
MKLTILMILCFMASNHPIFMILIMIMTSLLLNVYMYMYMKNTWFIFLITLLILGGLLVIFLYITSLTPNKKFNFNKKIFLMLPLIFLPKITFISNNNTTLQMLVLFLPKSLTMLLMTLIYLILTLISIMVMLKSSMAPIKTTN